MLTAHELSRFAPSRDCHWAVILNRGSVRAAIIEIRSARIGGWVDGAEAVLVKRLRYDWKLYRLAIASRERERRAWRDTRAAEAMFNAIVEPMIRAAE